MKMWHLQGQL